MANDYYNPDGNPANNSAAKSSVVRTIFAAIGAAFDKMPGLSGNGSKIVAVNSAGTALESVAVTGTGSVARATSPTLVTPALGVATATSINKVSITAPATGATLTIADGKTLTVSNTITFTGADGVSLNISDAATLTALSASSGSALMGFIQSGAGANARTVQSKLRDIVNIKDFGAVMDGSTDDTTSIQNAINAVSSAGGGTVIIPIGTTIVSTIAIASNITLRGYGAKSIIKRKAGTSSNLITATSLSSIALIDFYADGNSAATSGSVNNILITGCSDALVDGVRSIDSRLHGISMQYGTDTTNDTASEIRNCVVKTTVGYGIEVQDCDRVSVHNNRILKAGTFGILIYGTTNFAVQNVSITDNKVIEAGQTGIAIPFVSGGTTLTPGVEEVVVDGNVIEACGENGIMVQSRFSSVTGNTATRNGTTSSHQGILINCLTTTVTGNTVTKSAGVGIDFGDCKRVTCSSNVVEESGIIGIEINSTEDYSVIGNIVVNNCQTASAGALSAGILAHLGTGGYVFAGSSSNGTISGNIVRSGPNQLYGIKVTADTDNLRLVGNDALSAGSTRDYEILTPNGQFTCESNNVASPTITPASSVTIPQVGNYFYVSAGVAINTIVTDGGTYEFGRKIVLKFNGAVTIGNGTGNIYLESAFTATDGSALVLIRADSSNWLEISRKA